MDDRGDNGVVRTRHGAGAVSQIAEIAPVSRREFFALVGWRAVQCGAGAALLAYLSPAAMADDAPPSCGGGGSSNACGTAGQPPTNTCSQGLGPGNVCSANNTCSTFAGPGAGNKCNASAGTANACEGTAAANNCLGTPSGVSNECTSYGSFSAGNRCEGSGTINYCNPGGRNSCSDPAPGKGNVCNGNNLGAENICVGVNTCAMPYPNWCGPLGSCGASNKTEPEPD